jgi:hypothetical protein
MRILSCAAAALATNTSAAVAANLHTIARMIELLQNTSLCPAYWSNKAQESQLPTRCGPIASAAGKPHYIGSC